MSVSYGDKCLNTKKDCDGIVEVLSVTRGGGLWVGGSCNKCNCLYRFSETYDPKRRKTNIEQSPNIMCKMFVCQYCGRDDFGSANARNGHLRWCK